MAMPFQNGTQLVALHYLCVRVSTLTLVDFQMFQVTIHASLLAVLDFVTKNVLLAWTIQKKPFVQKAAISAKHVFNVGKPKVILVKINVE